MYHLVLATKYRRKIFNPGVYGYFRIKLFEIRQLYPEIEIREVNHDRDHVHLLLSIPPKMSVSELVRLIKTNTWSDGYFVSTVGVNEKTIANYVKLQEQEDSGQAKLEL